MGLYLLGLAAGAVATGLYFRSGVAPAQPAPTEPASAATGTAAPGTVAISSRPPGALVVIDGVARGATPIELSLAAGMHVMELQNGDGSRTVPLAIEAGQRTSQHVELPVAPRPVRTGQLDITSDPPGSAVRVDGSPRGFTPLMLPNVAPGRHTIVVSDGRATVNRSITVAAGTTASVFVSSVPAAATTGWVAISSPLELQVLLEGRLLGTTRIERLPLPTGRHELELVNTTFGYRSRLAVDIRVDDTTTTTVTLPRGSLSVNATPWAEVWLDGRPVGPTPLGNLEVTIGPHEIVVRHPELGERQQTVAVTTRVPARVGIDLSK